MRKLLRILAFLFLSALGGCSTTRGLEQDSDPVLPRPWGNDRVLLHNPGSIMLGPGLGKNAWRWLGDGEWGF